MKSDVYEEVCDRVAGSGVLTLGKPLSAPLFHQTLRLALASAERLSGKEREIERLKDKLEESRLVGRAKCVLIASEGMSEAGAHRWIEKQAMDRRTSRREVAEEILRLYED